MRGKKEKLIPFEKSERIIYVEQRGYEEKKSKGAILFAVLAALCLVYCMCIALFMGYGTKFFLIWGAMAFVFGLLSFFLAHAERVSKLPAWIKVGFGSCCAVGLLLFVLVEGMVLTSFGSQAEPGADYMIVLGAQWKKNGPSYVLQKRLDEAVAYLQESPSTIVIVSGGQGSDEVISEAEGMKKYLIQAGVAGERILMEDQSTSTYENLQFSGQLLDKENDTVVLVTNNFHTFRAVKIGEKLGYKHIEGQSADSYPAMLPNNLLREFFCVLKDFLVGNL